MKSRRLKTTGTSVALVVVLTLGACGGNGGGGSGGGPGPNAGIYAVGGTVSGLTGSGLVLQNNGGDDLSIGADGSFAFATRLADGGTYNVTVKTQASDQSCAVTNGVGTIAGADIANVTVSCKARNWTGAAQVITDDSSGVKEAVHPAVAVDAGGNTIVVWEQFTGGRTDIFANRYRVATKTWGTPTAIETDNAGNALRPRIAIDPDGNAVVVWYQSDGTRTRIFANRYSAAADTWSTPTRLDLDHPGSATSPEIAVDTIGNATAVWTQPSDNGVHTQIWTNRTTASIWGTAVRIDSQNSDAASPQIAVGALGYPVIVWVQDTGGLYRIWANRYTGINFAWSGAELVDPGVYSGHSEFPSIAVDADGNAIAAWQWSNGPAGLVYARRYNATTHLWGPTQSLPLDTGFARLAQVAMDPNGNATVSWQQADSTPRSRLWARRFNAATQAWDTATRIETSSAGNALFQKVAMDSSGNAIVVWQQLDGLYLHVYTNRYRTVSGTWGTMDALVSHSANADAPEIAINRNGDAVAVWSESDGTHNTIWSNRYE